jgi:hypothetical protein
MIRYTVLYNCARGYKCFRSILASDPSAAAEICEAKTHNFDSLTAVLPFVGNY